MYGAIIKHKLRTVRGFSKNFLGSIVGLLIAAYFLFKQLYFVSLGGGAGITLTPKNIFYVLVVCVVISGYRVLFKVAPIITMNAATLHYLYSTRHFRLVLIGKYSWTFIKSVLLAASISGLFNGFQKNLMFGQHFFLLAGYLFLMVLLSWCRYHLVNKKVHMLIFACYITPSTALLIEGGIISMIISYGLVVIWMYYTIFRLRLNLIKYSKDLASADEITAAGSQFDMGKMTQIALENEAKKKRHFYLYQLPIKKSNAVFYKCLIETIRAGTAIWILLLGFIVAGFLLYRTSIFVGVPILGERAMSTQICVMAVMVVYLNIDEILKKQYSILLRKHQQGLFLPIEPRKIMWKYITFGSVIYAILTIFVGLLLGSKFYFLFLFYALYTFLFAAKFVMEARHIKLIKPFQIVIQVLSLAVGSFLVM